MGHIGTPNAVSKQEGAVGTGRATPQGSLCLHPPLKLPSIHTSSSYSQDTCLLTSRDMALKCHGGQQPTRVLISIISVMGSPPHRSVWLLVAWEAMTLKTPSCPSTPNIQGTEGTG